VAGTLDISQALREGVKALEPGLLADANRGILYIDEINLLDDHITDILLDAAALGVNVVEREGVSVSHPSRFLLIGTMNPEEGELRPQIADRIGLQVEVTALKNEAQRVEVMKRRQAFLMDPSGESGRYQEDQEQLRRSIQQAITLLHSIDVPDHLYAAIAQLTIKSEVPSHRADITILQCAKAIASLERRKQVDAEDILEGATLALGHRLSRDPFATYSPVDSVAIRRELEEILEAPIPKKKARMTTESLSR
jgi:Mg-chelatase subunit ChlI